MAINKQNRNRYLIAAAVTLLLHGSLFLIAYVNEFSFINFVFFKKHYDSEFFVETLTEESKAGTGTQPAEQKPPEIEAAKPNETVGTSIKNTEIVKGITDTLQKPDTLMLAEAAGSKKMNPDEGVINSNGFGGYGEYGNFGIEGHKPKFLNRESEYFGNWFHENFNYPKEAPRGYNERVKISFVIDKEGRLRNPTVYGCSNTLVENEILKTVRTSPTWSPGEVKGIPRDIMMEMYISFKQ
jgi:hypothetical protein